MAQEQVYDPLVLVHVWEHMPGGWHSLTSPHSVALPFTNCSPGLHMHSRPWKKQIFNKYYKKLWSIQTELSATCKNVWHSFLCIYYYVKQTASETWSKVNCPLYECTCRWGLKSGNGYKCHVPIQHMITMRVCNSYSRLIFATTVPLWMAPSQQLMSIPVLIWENNCYFAWKYIQNIICTTVH